MGMSRIPVDFITARLPVTLVEGSLHEISRGIGGRRNGAKFRCVHTHLRFERCGAKKAAQI